MYLKSWPKCGHMNVRWAPGQCGRGDGVWFAYECGQCAQCGRPLLRALPADLPVEMVRSTRRHVAWSYLGKMYEHAGNTLVVRV